MRESAAILPVGAPRFRDVLNREGAILAFGLLCVMLLLELGKTHVYHAWFGSDVRPPAESLESILPFIWTASVSVVSRLLLPLAFIVVVLRERPADFGFRFAGGRTFVLLYVALLVIMVPIVWIAAGSDAFQQKYPFWDGARTSWRYLLLYELRYFFVFLSGEAFWRGFLVFGLFRRFGWHALSVAMVPYVIVHFGKPPIETLGAIVTAYVLGYLAIKHRSFLFGVALHFSVALLMDLAALLRSGQLPDAW